MYTLESVEQFSDPQNFLYRWARIRSGPYSGSWVTVCRDTPDAPDAYLILVVSPHGSSVIDFLALNEKEVAGYFLAAGSVDVANSPWVQAGLVHDAAWIDGTPPWLNSDDRLYRLSSQTSELEVLSKESHAAATQLANIINASMRDGQEADVTVQLNGSKFLWSVCVTSEVASLNMCTSEHKLVVTMGHFVETLSADSQTLQDAGVAMATAFLERRLRVRRVGLFRRQALVVGARYLRSNGEWSLRMLRTR